MLEDTNSLDAAHLISWWMDEWQTVLCPFQHNQSQSYQDGESVTIKALYNEISSKKKSCLRQDLNQWTCDTMKSVELSLPHGHTNFHNKM